MTVNGKKLISLYINPNLLKEIDSIIKEANFENKTDLKRSEYLGRVIKRYIARYVLERTELEQKKEYVFSKCLALGKSAHELKIAFSKLPKSEVKKEINEWYEKLKNALGTKESKPVDTQMSQSEYDEKMNKRIEAILMKHNLTKEGLSRDNSKEVILDAFKKGSNDIPERNILLFFYGVQE